MDRRKNIFDMFGALVPGYSGYAEREGRRQCDKLLREEISTLLLKLEKILEEIIQVKILEKNYNEMNATENLRKRINTLCSKIKYATYGNSGFFNNSQIKENELMVIYQYDLGLIKQIKDLELNIKSLNINSIKEALDTLENSFDKRNSYIKEYK